MAMTLTTDSIEQFQRWLSARGRAANTAKAYGADLRGYFEFAGDHAQSDFEMTAAEYLTLIREEKAAKTTRRCLGTLRVYGKWLGFPDPLGDYLAPTPARPMPHPLPGGITDVLAMVGAAGDEPDHRNLVGLCGLAGLRVGEAVIATVDDVDVDDMTLHVYGKGSKERDVPLSARLLAILLARLQEPGEDRRLVRLHERSARRIITKLGAKVGIPRDVSSHDLRATFATEAYKRSMDLRAVQELLGHNDSKTTEVYTGITMSSMRAASDFDAEEVA